MIHPHNLETNLRPTKPSKLACSLTPRTAHLSPPSLGAGTGLVEVPAGAAYARVEFATNGGMTGDFYLDDMRAVEL